MTLVQVKCCLIHNSTSSALILDGIYFYRILLIYKCCKDNKGSFENHRKENISLFFPEIEVYNGILKSFVCNQIFELDIHVFVSVSSVLSKVSTKHSILFRNSWVVLHEMTFFARNSAILNLFIISWNCFSKFRIETLVLFEVSLQKWLAHI